MVWRVVQTYLPWSSNPSMLTHIQHLHGNKKVWFHTCECDEKNYIKNFKQQALSTEKKLQHWKGTIWKGNRLKKQVEKI